MAKKPTPDSTPRVRCPNCKAVTRHQILVHPDPKKPDRAILDCPRCGQTEISMPARPRIATVPPEMRAPDADDETP